MKPDSNFKMKKPIKRMLTLGKFKNVVHKNNVKKLFISAQLSEIAAERNKFKSNMESTTVDSL